nr:voltage-gated chloride channel [Gordonia sp. NB41Y]
MPPQKPDESPTHDPGDPDVDPTTRVVVWMTLLAAVAGVITGFVGGAFRWLLVRADRLRLDIVAWAHDAGPAGWLVPIAVSAVAAGIAGLIGARIPLSAGSGIQHVEAVDRKEADPPTGEVIPARFVGGLLSIGIGGLVLGREGPTVHMGAAIGALCGRLVRATADEIRVLQSVMSGAGLAVAFNAPIGGALFCLEEVAHTFRLRYVLWTMSAVALAVMCSRVILGDHPDFQVFDVAEPAFSTLPVFVVFGGLLALLGVAYGWLIRACLTAFAAVSHIPKPLRSAAIGAVIGAVLMVDADLVGGGDTLTQAILAGQHLTFIALVVILVVRFAAGPLSYAANTSGGLFAPMLALGALCGVLFARVLDLLWAGLGTDLLPALMLVGMATLFTSVVRAPLTGAVLVMEMTATTSVAVAILAAGAAAMIVAQLLDAPPIYDSLRQRMLGAEPDER